MRKQFIPRTLAHIMLGMCAILLLCIPSNLALAADSKPTCELTVTTSRGEVIIGAKGSVALTAGDKITVAWKSENATQALDSAKKQVPLSGNISETPQENKTYTYTFMGSGKKAKCSVAANIVEGTFDYHSLTTTSLKPSIFGTAAGTKNVQVTLRKDVFDEKPLYASAQIKVKNGIWKLKIPKKLPDGTYNINLYASKEMKLGYIVSGTLTVTSSGAPTIVFASRQQPPARVVKGGGEADIATFSLTNTSKGLATINGAYVKSTGTVDNRAVIGLGAEDDQGGSKGFSGGLEGYSPFKNKLAAVPFTLTLKPNETRVLTLSVGISKNLAPYFGKTLGIEVYGIQTAATVLGGTVTGTTLTLE